MANEERIRALLAEHARLPVPVDDLSVNDDLFQKGMTSHASVNVMLALEEEFDVEFPDALLKKSTLQSIAAITAAIETLVSAAVV